MTLQYSRAELLHIGSSPRSKRLLPEGAIVPEEISINRPDKAIKGYFAGRTTTDCRSEWQKGGWKDGFDRNNGNGSAAISVC